MGEPSRSRAQQDDLRAFLRHPGSPYSRQRSHERTAFLLTASTTPEGQKGQQKRNTHTLSQVTSKQERKKEGEKTKKAEREGRKDRSGKGGEARKVSQERERERATVFRENKSMKEKKIGTRRSLERSLGARDIACVRTAESRRRVSLFLSSVSLFSLFLFEKRREF